VSGRSNLHIGGRSAYALLGIVVVLALVVGSRHDVAPTAEQRIAHLDSIIKCPDCADLSIAQSQSSAAVGLRLRVAELVRAGSTDAGIESIVVNKYGNQELLAPHGGSGWVAVSLPIAAFLLGAAVLGTTLVRRRKVQGPSSSESGDEDLVLVAEALRSRREEL
jgi:cytochrome c-type biogenesis protein CcmH/NrfF